MADNNYTESTYYSSNNQRGEKSALGEALCGRKKSDKDKKRRKERKEKKRAHDLISQSFEGEKGPYYYEYILYALY